MANKAIRINESQLQEIIKDAGYTPGQRLRYSLSLGQYADKMDNRQVKAESVIIRNLMPLDSFAEMWRQAKALYQQGKVSKEGLARIQNMVRSGKVQ